MEDETEYDCDGLPKCPDCKVGMSYDGYYDENGRKRDTESMSGYTIEYFICDNCNSKYTLVNKNLSLNYPRF